MEMVIRSGCSVTVALPVAFEVVAVIVTVVAMAIFVGATYKPVLEIVPTVPLPPETPLTFQVTVFPPGAQAENCWDWPTARVTDAGETATVGALSAAKEKVKMNNNGPVIFIICVSPTPKYLRVC